MPAVLVDELLRLYCMILAFAHITYICKHVNFRASRCDGGAKGASGASSALRASVFINIRPERQTIMVKPGSPGRAFNSPPKKGTCLFLENLEKERLAAFVLQNTFIY